MTCAYNTYFATIWLTNVLSIPAAISLFVWALVNVDVPSRAITGASLGAVALAWVIYLRLHGPRVLMRAGAWPAVCTGDYFPRTETELMEAVREIMQPSKDDDGDVERSQKTPIAPKVPPTIVGSGWGFFLYRKGPRGPRIFLHDFKGRVPGKPGGPIRWLSGTTIAEVNRYYLKDDKTFKTHPTMDYISIGAWFACFNHGNGGSPAGKSSEHLKVACVLNMKTIELTEYDDVEKLRELFDGPRKKDHCIVWCEFHKLVDNEDLQKRCIVVDSLKAATKWMETDQQLRLLFVGAARGVGLGVQWGPSYGNNFHRRRDPHFCSRFCQFLQVDICSAVCGWYESATYEIKGVKFLKAYTGMSTRYEANRWMPTVWPIQTLSVVIGGYRNFEIFFKLPPGPQDTPEKDYKILDGETLWRLVDTLIEMHKKHGGRSEIRHGATESPICLDVSMNRDFDAPFKLLKNEFGVQNVALHPGKWNEVAVYPCRRIKVTQLDPPASMRV